MEGRIRDSGTSAGYSTFNTISKSRILKTWLGGFYVTAILDWGWGWGCVEVEIEAVVDLKLSLSWGWGRDWCLGWYEVKLKFSWIWGWVEFELRVKMGFQRVMAMFQKHFSDLLM